MSHALAKGGLMHLSNTKQYITLQRRKIPLACLLLVRKIPDKLVMSSEYIFCHVKCIFPSTKMNHSCIA